MQALDNKTIDSFLFCTQDVNVFKDIPIEEDILHKLYALTSRGLTTFNCQAARFFFIKSKHAKNMLCEGLLDGDKNLVQSAPITVVVAADLNFSESLEETYPIASISDILEDDPELRRSIAFRSAAQAGAYLISSAHMLGLDAGLVSGFDKEKIDLILFEGTSLETDFLINIGYGDYENSTPAFPRLKFSQACAIL